MRLPWPRALLDLVKHPRCAKPFWSPATDAALRDETISAMKRFDITGVVSGEPERVAEYTARLRDRVIPALYFSLAHTNYTPDEMQHLFDSQGFKVLGEMSDQYDGVAPNDPRLNPYWKFAAERDIPVAIHVGVGPPGAPYTSPGFRARLHSPLYGTDQIVWPGLIEAGIRAINAAPFLTTVQKKAILHDNAERFLHLRPKVPAS